MLEIHELRREPLGAEGVATFSELLRFSSDGRLAFPLCWGDGAAVAVAVAAGGGGETGLAAGAGARVCAGAAV